MKHSNSEQMISYLYWLKERGQTWPHYRAYPSNSKINEKLDRKPEPGMNDSNSSTLKLAGSRHAKIIGIVDYIEGQEIIFGQERNLLLKILQAMKMDVKRDFLLIGLATDQCSRPTASSAISMGELANVIQTTSPKLTISFGRLVDKHFFPDSAECFENKVARLQKHQKGAVNVHVLPLWHLQDLSHNGEFKRLAWQALKPYSSLENTHDGDQSHVGVGRSSL